MTCIIICCAICVPVFDWWYCRYCWVFMLKRINCFSVHMLVMLFWSKCLLRPICEDISSAPTSIMFFCNGLVHVIIWISPFSFATFDKKILPVKKCAYAGSVWSGSTLFVHIPTKVKHDNLYSCRCKYMWKWHYFYRCDIFESKFLYMSLLWYLIATSVLLNILTYFVVVVVYLFCFFFLLCVFIALKDHFF